MSKPTHFSKTVDGMQFTGPTAETLRNSVNEQIREEMASKGEFTPKVIVRKKSGEVSELKPARVTQAMKGAGW